MSLAEALLREFDREMAVSRRVLENVPEDRLDFRPHPTSQTLARLAGHVAEMPLWATVAIETPAYDDDGSFPPLEMRSRQQILQEFDRACSAAHRAIAASSDQHLTEPWSLTGGGRTFFTLPRAEAIRHMVTHHMIHHRGQLSVYLRMTGARVPSLYGPSLDEQ